jgi:nicotinate phosphoribosyltransferase
MQPVISSLLDNDLYKFTMWQTLLHRHPETQAEYSFYCRNSPAVQLAPLAGAISEQIDHLCTLRFTRLELDYLASLRFIRSDFIDFLRLFQFQRDFVEVSADGRQLRITARGPQVHVMGFEIYVLSLVNELYFKGSDQDAVLNEGRTRLSAKIDRLRDRLTRVSRHFPFEFFDFGGRRRFSEAWQREVVQTLARRVPEYFRGTSNVKLALELGLRPIGTMAHEYLQTYQALGVQLRLSQKAALEDWVQEYRGDLGIALTDVISMDAFLSDFDLYFAKLFDGLRHDSGDPIEWGEKALAHYAKLGLDPHHKRLVFSDGLDLDTAVDLYEHFADRIQVGFGIGTNLTNDVGHTPLNVVMKLTSANGLPVAKLSDSPGKTLCDNQPFLAYLRQVFGVTSA